MLLDPAPHSAVLEAAGSRAAVLQVLGRRLPGAWLPGTAMLHEQHAPTELGSWENFLLPLYTKPWVPQRCHWESSSVLQQHRALAHRAAPHLHSPPPVLCFLASCWAQSWATAASQGWKKRLCLEDERIMSTAPKGNCLVLVIDVTSYVTFWSMQMPGHSKFRPVCAFAWAAGVKREPCVTFAGGGRGGVGRREEISFWNKTWAAFKKDDFLWGVVCSADLSTDHEEQEPGRAGARAINQRRAKLQGSFRFCRTRSVAFGLCKAEPKAGWCQDHLKPSP